MPWEAAYHASKFAMIGFSQSLKYELEQLKIAVCCFIPGGMKTNIFKKSVAASFKDQHPSHPQIAFYKRNVLHMHQVMQGFHKSAVPVEKAPQTIAKLLRQNQLPLKKHFGKDAKFVRVLSWLGLQNLLSKQFTVS